MTDIPTLDQRIGGTRLVALQRIPNANSGNRVLAKLEGDNPAGSVKDRPALNMILRAAERGEIEPGDRLIEATSGNTGIALAMAATILGYRMVLIMPDNLSLERRQLMKAYGAELILVTQNEGMEGARDRALAMQARGEGKVLNQFANPDNPDAHYRSTGPEIWRDSAGEITHMVCTMGTTGTIMGLSRFFKEQNPAIQMIGVQPADGAQIPGIRAWPEEYLPAFFERERVDRIIDVTQGQAEEMTRRLATEEGIFAGISSGGAMHVAIKLSEELENATIVSIVCDRGDRYLSTGVFPG